MPHQPPPVPQPDRPQIEGYGIPETLEGLLTWDFVTTRMEKARNYWLATTGPDGHPHAVPVWGIWLDGTLHFGGGPATRWQRNLAVALGNAPPESRVVAALVAGRNGAGTLVREHIDWALARHRRDT